MRLVLVRRFVFGTGVFALAIAIVQPSAGDPLTERDLDAIRAGDNCYHAAPLILPVYTCEECQPASAGLFATCGDERDEDCIYYSGNTYNVECRVDIATCGGKFIHYDDQFCVFLATIAGTDCTRAVSRCRDARSRTAGDLPVATGLSRALDVIDCRRDEWHSESVS